MRLGLTTPARYGGHEAPLTHQAILLEEMGRAEAPEHVGVIGLGMAGPTILAHGTDEQRDRFLRPILTGQEVQPGALSKEGQIPGLLPDLGVCVKKLLQLGD